MIYLDWECLPYDRHFFSELLIILTNKGIRWNVELVVNPIV